jgi:hypothetical protein
MGQTSALFAPWERRLNGNPVNLPFVTCLPPFLVRLMLAFGTGFLIAALL